MIQKSTLAFNIQAPPLVPIYGSELFFPVRRIWCVGRNFVDHALEMGGQPEKEPPFFFAKPADAEDVEKALLADPSKRAAPPENPMSADRVKWEHIHRVFELCNRNVSETARRLKMHRRTLQRILSKRSPR